MTQYVNVYEYFLTFICRQNGEKMAKTPRKLRKRGRPPKGEFANKNATLTTRLTEPVREGLEREAKRNGRSLSQEVERRLFESLEAPKRWERAFGNVRNRALAYMVAQLAEGIEQYAHKSWRHDPYTCQALEFGLKVVVGHYAPEGKPEVPDTIAADIARSPEINEQFKRPEGLGWAIAQGLIDAVRTHREAPPVNHPENVAYADGFYQFPKVHRAFGLDKETEK